MSSAEADAPSGAAVSDEALQRAEQYIEEEEGAANKLHGWLNGFVRLTAFVMAAFRVSGFALSDTVLLVKLFCSYSSILGMGSVVWAGRRVKAKPGGCVPQP
jgi:hypothetical protein